MKRAVVRDPRSGGEARLQPVASAAATIVALVTVVVATTLTGCSPSTRDNPKYCQVRDDCKPGEVCASPQFMCRPADAGAVGSTGGASGMGGVGGAATGGRSGTGGADSDGGAADLGASGDGGVADAAPDDGRQDASDTPVGCARTCTGTTPVCNLATLTCGCGSNTDCQAVTPAAPHCDLTAAMPSCVACLANKDCVGDVARPLCSAGRVCVGCQSNKECTDNMLLPACVLAPGVGAGSCVECTTTANCAGTKPICAADRRCAACASNRDCADNMLLPACVLAPGVGAGSCVECTTAANCAGTKPICAADHRCAPCASNKDCTDNMLLPACVTTVGPKAGTCVECTTSLDCAGTKPVCDRVANRCVPCARDAQCAEKGGADNPGICMAHSDGHCATNAEIIYVQPMSGCDDSATATGQALTPFCTPQRAITAVTPARSIIVMRRGMIPLERWTYGAAADLTVIGQGGAVIGPAAGVGITITAGRVYLRDLGVSLNLDAGISVSNGATIRMDRCIVTQNKGGLIVNGANFDISNSVFADNDGTLTPVTFGGVYLNNPTGTLSSFRNNTIFDNGAVGLVCNGPYPVKGLLVTRNTIAQVMNCAVDASSLVSGTTDIDPLFDVARPYHLTAVSPCVDRGGTTDFPPLDLDGNPRPSPTAGPSDCGAHEFQK